MDEMYENVIQDVHSLLEDSCLEPLPLQSLQPIQSRNNGCQEMTNLSNLDLQSIRNEAPKLLLDIIGVGDVKYVTKCPMGDENFENSSNINSDSTIPLVQQSLQDIENAAEKNIKSEVSPNSNLDSELALDLSVPKDTNLHEVEMVSNLRRESIQSEPTNSDEEGRIVPGPEAKLIKSQPTRCDEEGKVETDLEGIALKIEPPLLTKNLVHGGVSEHKECLTSYAATGEFEAKGCQKSRAVDDLTIVSSSRERKERNYDVLFLVNILSKCHQFTSSIQNLCNYKDINEYLVTALARQYPEIFQIEKDLIKLTLPLKVCKNYGSLNGCTQFESCVNLHICKDYIEKNCRRKKCLYGHKWDTDHNYQILYKFHADLVPHFILRKFIQEREDARLNCTPIDICLEYNKGVCLSRNCPSLHICLSYFIGLLKGVVECESTCSINHNILSSSCYTLLSKNNISTNESPRDIAFAIRSANPSVNYQVNGTKRKWMEMNGDMKQNTSQTIWTHYSDGDIEILEICYPSVESICPQEKNGCKRLHAKKHFHWQVSEVGNYWLNFRSSQVQCLEVAFCNPAVDSIMLPRLDPSDFDSSMNLFLLMGQEIWSSDFNKMILRNESATKKLKIRRLSVNNMYRDIIPSSSYSWYFLKDNKTWQKYGSMCENSNGVNTLSSYEIESAYLQDPTSHLTFSNARYTYELYLQDMLQVNKQTNKFRKVKRRPEPHLIIQEGIQNLPQMWITMPHMMRYQCVTLSETSTEYQMVFQLLNQGRPFRHSWISIERIQNIYLWRAFQNKVNEMTIRYGNVNAVNIQQLFHGTTNQSARQICDENFDWRLHGNRNGHAFGKGTYFTNDPIKASKYARADDNGYRFIFVAKVAVGTTVRGHPQMKKPPINPMTKLPYDSSVGGGPLDRASIIVKYDKQEYYPEYIITFKS